MGAFTYCIQSNQPVQISYCRTISIESGGRPNGVVTFRHADTKSFEGPLISVFVEAARHKDSGKYVYELTQSEEQEEVNALRDFFREEEGGSNDPDGVGVVEYEICSIFIDASNECDPANVDSCNLSRMDFIRVPSLTPVTNAILPTLTPARWAIVCGKSIRATAKHVSATFLDVGRNPMTNMS